MNLDEDDVYEYDNALICAPGGMDDWYVIQKANHDGRNWFAPIKGGGQHFMCSSRIGNADIEGDKKEMLVLARAILDGEKCAFRRCSVSKPKNGRVHLNSPRNSIGYASVPVEQAHALARQIFFLLEHTNATQTTTAPDDG